MTITELIKKLEELKFIHGDLEVYDSNGFRWTKIGHFKVDSDPIQYIDNKVLILR